MIITIGGKRCPKHCRLIALLGRELKKQKTQEKWLTIGFKTSPGL